MRLVIIEDNPADVTLFRQALRFSGIDAEVSHFSDGIAAVAALGTAREPWTPAPDIVFLDLNMPRMNGFEVLEILRSSVEGAAVRVAVFTSSQSPEDKETASRLRADRFVRKPTNLREFFTAVNSTVRELTS